MLSMIAGIIRQSLEKTINQYAYPGQWDLQRQRDPVNVICLFTWQHWLLIDMQLLRMRKKQPFPDGHMTLFQVLENTGIK
jgi:hypothetical protein